MQLQIDKIIKYEVIHYQSGDDKIYNIGKKVYAEINGNKHVISLPHDRWTKYFNFSRLARRVLRLDKSNVLPVDDGLIIIYQGVVYFYDFEEKTLTKTLELQNCRNIMHQSIYKINDNEIIFGEYGTNHERNDVPIYKSNDGGRSWKKVYTFAGKEVRHVHACCWDPYEEKVWVFTGDFGDETKIMIIDKDFQDEPEFLGDGTQSYRACSAFFEKNYISWIMDSELETCYQVTLDRKSRTINKTNAFPGPVWYTKYLQDGYYLASTVQEIGEGVKDEFVHVYVSKDLEHWKEISKLKSDGLPKRYFKFGVVGFCDGEQNSKNFYIHTEAVKGLDGKVALCSLSA